MTMWQILHSPPDDQAFFFDYVHESIGTIIRNIVLAFSGLYLAGLLFAMIRWPTEFNWPLMPSALLIFLTATLTYWLVHRQFVLSQVIWQIGMAVAIVHTAAVFQRAELLFLLAFLPMIMVIALGILPALVSGVFLIALMALLTQIPQLLPIPPEYIAEIGAGGFLGGVLGQAFGSSLFTVTKWSLDSYQEAQRNLEEVRKHRGHLARLTKDLDEAYFRLERTNAALTNAWRKADEAERLKTEFVLNVSHELRTPLNLILGFSEVISRSPESYRGETLPSAYRRDVNAIYNSAKHLLALIDDVLDLGRIDAGKVALVRDDVAPENLVNEVVDMVGDYIHAKGLNLQVVVEENLPALWIDSLRIRQALLNLLANAARFTLEGYIRLEVFRRDGNIVFQVKDSGAGITESEIPHVFDLFHSADPLPDAKWHSGTGLGLPLSKKYVEMHGGSMGVESRHGQGSTFWFSLPGAAAAVRPAGMALLSAAPPPDDSSHPAEKIVVVVNDDPAVLSLLQHHLGAFRFLSAPAFPEGLALAEETKAVALIADPAAAGSIRQSPIPIVHFPWPTSRQAAASLGARGFLTKPVSARQLLAAIEGLGRPVRRILIADSDPELVRLFQRMLRARLSMRNCLEAYNGEEVIQRAVAEQPDLVLMELSLLQAGGGGEMKRISDIEALRDIPVILTSERNWEDLCLRLTGPIQAFRPEGFELGEIVKYAEALFNAFSPGWNMEPMRLSAQSG